MNDSPPSLTSTSTHSLSHTSVLRQRYVRGMDMHSGAGQSSYRYGKSERVCCDGVAGILYACIGRRCTCCGYRVVDMRRGTVRGMLAGKAVSAHVCSRALFRVSEKHLT